MLTLNIPTSVGIFFSLFSVDSYDNNEENLFNNQELLYLGIIFFILVTVVFDLVAILLGEIRWLSLQGIKMLTSAP